MLHATCLLGLLLVAPGAFPQDRLDDSLPAADPGLSVEALMQHVRVLASDELGEREAGSEGGRLAADHLARSLARSGLEGLGTDGGFGMPLAAVRIEPRTPPRLLMTRRVDGVVEEGRLGVDFSLKLRGALEDSGPCELLRLSTNADLEVEPAPGLALFPRYDASERDDEVRLRARLKDDAWGLVVQVASSERDRPRQERIEARILLGEEGPRRPEEVTLFGEMRETLLWRGYRAAHLVVDEERTPLPASNVLALVRGSDPELSEEVVLLHAPYDLGGLRPTRGKPSDGEDSVRNGAEGMAACAALLELAEACAADPPARSVLFLFTTATNHDRLGLREFLAHPPVPLADIVLALTLERVAAAQGSPGRLYLMGNEQAALADVLSADGLDVSTREKRLRRPSEANRAMARAGLPARVLECTPSTRRVDAYADNADGVDVQHLLAVTQTLEGILRRVSSDGFERPER